MFQRACHALSLDDERTTFQSTCYGTRRDGRATTDSCVVLSFHSNVGGGYPDDSLVLFPLYWIMRRRDRAPEFQDHSEKPTIPDPDMMARTRMAPHKGWPLYDLPHGLGGYYRY